MASAPFCRHHRRYDRAVHPLIPARFFVQESEATSGFLHQATVSSSTQGGASLPDGWLTHDIAEPIRLETDGTFTVNPVLFSKIVLATISRDFASFEADAPLLPRVARRDPITIPSTYVGTVKRAAEANAEGPQGPELGV